MVGRRDVDLDGDRRPRGSSARRRDRQTVPKVARRPALLCTRRRVHKKTFASTSFAVATKEKDTVMKMKSSQFGKINAMQQSDWVKPALMTLTLLFAVLGAIGCAPHH